MPEGTAKPSHWDLMLEQERVLETYTLWQFPRLDEPELATRDADHRMIYLEYEGPVSGERGYVLREDSGTYEALERTKTGITLHVNGQRLTGRLILRLDPDSPAL